MTRQLRPVLAALLLSFLSVTAAEAGNISLAWNKNPETNIASYEITYGTATGQYATTVNVGNVTTWRLTVPESDTRTYYFRVRALNSAGLASPYSNEAAGMPGTVTTAPASVMIERVALGLTPFTGNGGWFTSRNDVANGMTTASWGRLPWTTYNNTGGSMRTAAGDVDGDGLDELVVGLGPGSNGWFAVLDDAQHAYALLKWVQVDWPTYNAANGEVWPAVGDLDNDGRDEIVIGFGKGGAGWVEIFEDAAGNFAHSAWRQVAFPAYIANFGGETHPAVANVDGTGGAEIIIGLGKGGGGSIEVLNGTSASYSHKAWLQVSWATYNAANGETFPAAGDIDGDGRAEIVAGLGSGGGGWMQVFEDANSNHSFLRWLQVSWPNYNKLTGGETHPSIGNVDSDALSEIVVGLGVFPNNGGWFEILDDGAAGANKSLGWKNLDWPLFTTSGGGVYPAVGKFR